MNDVALIANQAQLVQNETSMNGLKQQQKSEEAVVNMLVEAQSDLAAVTSTRGQVVNTVA